MHLSTVKQLRIMTTFLIILGALLVTNYLLLEFSCNDATEHESLEDK
jgi:hypothetical protein